MERRVSEGVRGREEEEGVSCRVASSEKIAERVQGEDEPDW